MTGKPVISATPTLTPTVTVTNAATPTAVSTQPPPAELDSAEYVYDGDGSLVKSVINGIETYYVGTYYEKVVDGAVTTVRKYYFAGSSRIAMRENGELYWLLSDHLGSTSLTATANGEIFSEVRYSAFGEVRFSTNATPTDYLYTGQRMEEAGLYYFVARFYDPALAHFVQADTVVPGAGNPMAYNRYAYVGYSPIVYSDPSGHIRTGDDSLYPGIYYDSPIPATVPNSTPTVNGQTPDWANPAFLTAPSEDNYPLSGQQMYDLYLQLFYEPNGWWWAEGHFNIQDFYILMFYFEGYDVLNQNYDKVQNGFTLLEAVSEGSVRALYNYCDNKFECLGGSRNTATLLNFIGEFSWSIINRYRSIGNGNKGDDLLTLFGKYEWNNDSAKMWAHNFFNLPAGSNWTSGMKMDRPFGWGNDTTSYPTFLSFHASDPALVVWTIGNFFIPTGRGQKEYDNY